MCLTTAVAIFFPPEAVNVHVVVTERYVERQCELTELGMLIPLAYNMLLIVMALVLAFLTRALPENFNETWYTILIV